MQQPCKVCDPVTGDATPCTVDCRRWSPYEPVERLKFVELVSTRAKTRALIMAPAPRDTHTRMDGYLQVASDASVAFARHPYTLQYVACEALRESKHEHPSGFYTWNYEQVRALHNDKEAVLATFAHPMYDCGRYYKCSDDDRARLGWELQYESTLRYVSRELQADEEVILAALGQHKSAIKYADAKAFSASRAPPYAFTAADKDNLGAALVQYGDTKPGMSAEDEAFWVENGAPIADMYTYAIVHRTPSTWNRSMGSYIVRRPRADHVLAAWSDTAPLCDRDIVLRIVAHNGLALEYVDVRLRADRRVASTAVSQNGLALEYVDARLQDRQLVSAAIACNVAALQFAPSTLRADPQFVRPIVTRDGMALQWASPELRSDPSIVSAAVAHTGDALQFSSPEVLGWSAEGALQLVEQGLTRHISRPLWTTKDFVVAAVGIDGNTLQHASQTLRADADIVMVAVKQAPLALKHASLALRGNKVVVEAAMESAKSHVPSVARQVLRLASDELRKEVGRTNNMRRHRQARGGLTGRKITLVACNGSYDCVICHFVAQRDGAQHVPKRRKVSCANPQQRLNKHVQQHHTDRDPRFRSYRCDNDGNCLYGACVCDRESCEYTGTIVEGETWIRHPNAAAWQADLIQGQFGSTTCRHNT
jgi:hypothetical protein